MMTLSKGVNGTIMPSFSDVYEQERFVMVILVRSFRVLHFQRKILKTIKYSSLMLKKVGPAAIFLVVGGLKISAKQRRRFQDFKLE